MPQLDAGSFLSQTFWLSVFFGLWYMIGLQVFLPAVAAGRKTRTLKLSSAKGDASRYDGERVSVLSNYDTALGAAMTSISAQTVLVASQGDAWRSEQARSRDMTALSEANEDYLIALGGTVAQEELALAEEVDETF